jgi:hypothetical protein
MAISYSPTYFCGKNTLLMRRKKEKTPLTTQDFDFDFGSMDCLIQSISNAFGIPWLLPLQVQPLS